MQLTRLIDFSAKNHIKISRSINKNRTVFVLHVPERIMLRPCEAKVINTHTKTKLSHIITAEIWLLLPIWKKKLSIESDRMIKDSNANDFIKI